MHVRVMYDGRQRPSHALCVSATVSFALNGMNSFLLRIPNEITILNSDVCEERGSVLIVLSVTTAMRLHARPASVFGVFYLFILNPAA